MIPNDLLAFWNFRESDYSVVICQFLSFIKLSVIKCTYVFYLEYLFQFMELPSSKWSISFVIVSKSYCWCSCKRNKIDNRRHSLRKCTYTNKRGTERRLWELIIYQLKILGSLIKTWPCELDWWRDPEMSNAFTTNKNNAVIHRMLLEKLCFTFRDITETTMMLTFGKRKLFAYCVLRFLTLD